MKLTTFLSTCTMTVLLSSCAAISAEKPAEQAKAPAPPANTVKLQLPPCIYAVPDVEINVYFDNIVLVPNPDNYVFDVTCPKGRNDQKRWRFTPKASDVGTYKWSVKVIDIDGVKAEAAMDLIVSPANAGEGKNVSILVVGDSLTNATVYPSRIFDHFKREGNPKLKMVGSNGPHYKPQPDGVAHEGWGGWAWNTFISKTNVSNPANPKPYDIPSRFLVIENGKGTLNMQNYFNQYNEGKAPDFITFQLGVNDVFGANDDNINEKINTILASADILLAAARKDAPNAIIGVGLVTPGAKSQDAFGANYTCGQTRWQYKKNQHALNQAMLKKFADYPDKKLFIIPTSLNLDCENNFPVRSEEVNSGNPTKITRQCNGVHPAPTGYNQIGDTYYAWMKYFLSKQ